MDRGRDGFVELTSERERLWPVGAHDARDAPLAAARRLALRRIGKEELAAAAQPAFLQDGFDDLFRCAGPGGRFKNDQLPRPEGLGDRAGARLDEAQIRLPVRSERCWHANRNGVCLPQAGEVAGGIEPAAAGHGRDLAIRNIHDVGPSGGEQRRLFRVGVEAGHGKARLVEGACQRQADIAKSDDADPRAPVLQLPEQRVRHCRARLRHYLRP